MPYAASDVFIGLPYLEAFVAEKDVIVSDTVRALFTHSGRLGGTSSVEVGTGYGTFLG